MKVTSHRQIAIVLCVCTLLGGQLLAQGAPDGGHDQVCPCCQQPGPQAPDRGVGQMRGAHPQFGPPDRDPHRPGPMQLGHILHQLDLTQEQQDLVQEILETNREGAEAAQETVLEAHRTLGEAIENEDIEGVKAAATALAQAVQNQGLLIISITGAVKEVITEEQLQAWDQIKAQMKEHRAQGPGRPGQGGPRTRGQDPFGPQGPPPQPGQAQQPQPVW